LISGTIREEDHERGKLGLRESKTNLRFFAPPIFYRYETSMCSWCHCQSEQWWAHNRFKMVETHVWIAFTCPFCHR